MPPNRATMITVMDIQIAAGSIGVLKRDHRKPSMMPVNGLRLNANLYSCGTNEALNAIGLKNIPIRNNNGMMYVKSLKRIVKAAIQVPNAMPATIVKNVNGMIINNRHVTGTW